MTEGSDSRSDPAAGASRGLPAPTSSAPRGSAFLLRVGMAVAGTAGALGLLAFAAKNPASSLDQILGTGSVTPFLAPSGLWSGLVRGNPQAVLTLSILVLLAIPVARSAVVWLHFRRIRDRPLAWTGLAVLLLLVAALFALAPLVR